MVAFPAGRAQRTRTQRLAPALPGCVRVGIVLFLMRGGSWALSLGHMRAMVLVLGLAAMGCTKTVIVTSDGGVVAECASGYTTCEPAAAVDGGEAEYPLVCSDLQTDSHNCGACGNDACVMRGCVGGKCGACHATGGTCLSGPGRASADCCSGKCSAPAGEGGECE